MLHCGYKLQSAFDARCIHENKYLANCINAILELKVWFTLGEILLEYWQH